MDTVIGDDKYIFFLQLNEKLPDFYFDLVLLFKELGFTLVPVLPQSLKEFSYLEKKYFLVVRHDIESQTNFFKKENVYTHYRLKHSKILMMDVSSFGETPLVKKHRIQKSYRYYPLPMEFDEIAIRMAYLYYRDENVKQVWPGGRRWKR